MSAAAPPAARPAPGVWYAGLGDMGQDGMTTGDWLGALPAACAREIRTASVEPFLAAMFAHLPQPIELDADVPTDPAAIPLEDDGRVHRVRVVLGAGGDAPSGSAQLPAPPTP